MANLFKKSTKTLSFRTHIETSFDPQTLKNIFDKYDISVKIIYTKPNDYSYVDLSQKQQLDYKLYSAVFEIFINQNPGHYLSSEYPSDDMPFNPYISNNTQKLKLQLLELFRSIRQKYIEEKA